MGSFCSSGDDERLVSIGDVIKQRGIAAAIGRYHYTTSIDSIVHTGEEVLGSGSSGEVRLATDGDGTKFAVKSFDKDEYSDSEREYLRREVNIHMALDHPHILRLVRVFESDCQLQLVTEHMAGGDLYATICENGALTEQEAIPILCQILLAVSYLHAHKIIHRDLKLQNILFKDSERTHAKVIDFGMAITWDGERGVSEKAGTPCYFAPEMWTTDYTDKIDIWAVGLVAYELLTGHAAFGECRMMEKVRGGHVHYGSRFTRLSSEAQSFIRLLLSIDPEKRPSALDCLKHPWLRSAGRESPCPDVCMMQSLVDLAQQTYCRRVCLEMIASELTSKEQIDFEEQFNLIDQDKSGTISASEFCKAMKASLGLEATEANLLFTELTRCGVNEITFTEFVAASLQRNPGDHEDACRAAFHRLETDETSKLPHRKWWRFYGRWNISASLFPRSPSDRATTVCPSEEQSILSSEDIAYDASANLFDAKSLRSFADFISYVTLPHFEHHSMPQKGTSCVPCWAWLL